MPKKIKYILLIILCSSLSLSLLGCLNKDVVKNTNDSNKLTEEKIKKGYEDGNVGKITNTTKYYDNVLGTDYLLVEYTPNDTNISRFDFYNLKSGEENELPTIYNENVKLIKINNPGSIIFEADGKDTISNYNGFPKTIEYCRGKSNDTYKGDFRIEEKNKYLSIDSKTTFGNKPNESISDIKVSLKGVEVLFMPQPGMEQEFYADYTTIPITNTSYMQSKNQLIVEFKNTTINSKIKNKVTKISEENNYISSVSVEEGNKDCKLIITLKDMAKYYTVIDGHVEPKKDDFPYAKIEFSTEQEE